MDSCARGAFLSGGGFLVLLNWLQAARVSNSAVATKRIRVDRRRACSVNSMPKISLFVTTACYFWSVIAVVGPPHFMCLYRISSARIIAECQAADFTEFVTLSEDYQQ